MTACDLIETHQEVPRGLQVYQRFLACFVYTIKCCAGAFQEARAGTILPLSVPGMVHAYVWRPPFVFTYSSYMLWRI